MVASPSKEGRRGTEPSVPSAAPGVGKKTKKKRDERKKKGKYKNEKHTDTQTHTNHTDTHPHTTERTTTISNKWTNQTLVDACVPPDALRPAEKALTALFTLIAAIIFANAL